MIDDTTVIEWGTVQNVRTITTSTGRKMVTFTIDGCRCKAFGDIAIQVEKLEDYLVEVIIQEGPFKGTPEYLVTKVELMLVPVPRPLKPDELKHQRRQLMLSRLARAGDNRGKTTGSLVISAVKCHGLHNDVNLFGASITLASIKHFCHGTHRVVS